MTSPKTFTRIGSIDLLRGTIMLIMALDHVRDYFHHYSYLHDPLDLTNTSPAIFFTRWITHFCAPIFIFLAGTSAFLSGQRKSKKELSIFLGKRGLWLIILELTVINFAWFFNPTFSLVVLQVIWVLGVCMIALAGFIWLPRQLIIAIGLIMVFGHNLLDGTHVPGNGAAAFGWSLVHEFNQFRFGKLTIAAAYPIIPWIGVMALGYCFGTWYQNSYDAEKRKRNLIWLGLGGIVLFVVIRFTNVYGDPSRWSAQPSTVYTVLSFLNVNKYPPSLLYLLMTLSPAFLFLAFTEKVHSGLARVVSTYGRVPLFYYVLHIYLLHLGASLLASITGYGWHNMVFTQNWLTGQEALKGYGVSLPLVYLIWLVAIAILYPFCKRFDRYKQQNKSKWWLSYL